MTHLKVGVPEGIGDIVWVYRKVKPYCDTMDLIINHETAPSQGTIRNIQERSTSIMKFFPGVKEISHRYNFYSWTKNEIRLADLFKGDKLPEEFDYICNAFLERGVKLEEIDQTLQIQWDMKLPVQENPVLKSILGNYLLIYVSEYTGRNGGQIKLWNVNDWVNAIEKILFVNDLNIPVVLIGADFDRDIIEKIHKELASWNRESIILINQNLPQLCYTFKNCKYFIGYQSGLNILADEFDTKQMMLYFDFLPHMKDSWVKPANRSNGLFNYGFFGEDKNAILKRIKL